MINALKDGTAIYRISIFQLAENYRSFLLLTTPFIVTLFLSFWLLLLPNIYPLPFYDFIGFFPEMNSVSLIGFALVSLSLTVWACWIGIRWQLLISGSSTKQDHSPKNRIRLLMCYFRTAFNLGFVSFALMAFPVLVATLCYLVLEDFRDMLLPVLAVSVLVLFYYFYLRLSLVLPVAAHNKSFSLLGSFQETSKFRGAIFIASVLFTFSIIALSHFIIWLDVDSQTFGAFYFLIYWVFLMMLISLVTTIFRFVLENQK